MKTVLITGSSSGIGKAAAIYFNKKNWNVVATMRNPSDEKELNLLDNVICLKLDVTDLNSIKEAIAESIKKFGIIDVVVNNAGYSAVGPFEASTQEDIFKQFNTNVFGAMNVIREILPVFRMKKNGTIINVTSVGARLSFPLYSLYQGTKWGLDGFSEGLQHELAPFNIKIKIVQPGVTQSNFYSSSLAKMENNTINSYDKYVNKALPNMLASGQKATSPMNVAKTIYKAANSTSWKLRYLSGNDAYMLVIMRKLLPLSVFTSIIRKIVLK